MSFFFLGLSIGNSILAFTVGSEEALVGAVVSLILALAAYLRARTADSKSTTANTNAASANTTATVADTKATLANDRVSNVSKAQDSIRSDLTQVAKDSVTADSISTIVQAAKAEPAPPQDQSKQDL